MRQHHATQRGIYIWDLKVVDATDINGNPVADMEGVYRIYFRAGNPHYLYGSVDAPQIPPIAAYARLKSVRRVACACCHWGSNEYR